MFKYNFNKDKHLKYQLKRCLELEPYDTLEDAKFKALINSIGFIDAKDISILVGYWTMHNCIESSQCSFIPSAEYSFCNILAVAINKSNFDEVKKLLEQK